MYIAGIGQAVLELLKGAPANSQGEGAVEFSRKIFLPFKITLPLHRFIKEFQKNFPAL